MKISLRAGRQASPGFTLLEMLITLSIFILLTAAVFGIMGGVFQGTSTLQDNQNRRDEIVALDALLKKKLGELTAQSTLTSYRRGDGGGLAQDGIILVEGEVAEAFDARVQPNGYYTLRHTALFNATANNISPLQSFTGDITSDDSSLPWRPLITDLRKIAWRFQDPNTSQWVDFWNNLSIKPNLVECSFSMAGESQPVTMDFWIPRIDPAETVAPQSAITVPSPTPTNAR